MTPPAGGGSATTVDDYYQLGQLAYQTNGAGTLLASYTYDQAGAPESVQVGSDPTTAPRYYYVYDARGDVVNLTDASGVSVADYSYDTWGALTNSSETIPNANGWVNPYRYDGRDGVRSDVATGLDWMAVRAYDPTLGRFLARDPLGRAPLVFADNPYVYAGNNPLTNVDPSGQYRAAGFGSAQRESGQATNQQMAHIVTQSGCDKACQAQVHQEWLDAHIAQARGIAGQAAAYFSAQAKTAVSGFLHLPFALIAFMGAPIVSGILNLITAVFPGLAAITPTFYTLVSGLLIYDLIAAHFADVFHQEVSANNSFWLNPSGITGNYSGLQWVTMGVGAAIAALSVLFITISTELTPLWVVFGVLSEAAVASLLLNARSYVDQEEQALGYVLS